jgi:ABC-type oligopeptide transport system substrate-binding subunit
VGIGPDGRRLSIEILTPEVFLEEVLQNQWRSVPNTFIDFFVSGSDQSGTGWSDPTFDSMLAEANATVDSNERLRKLADCERFLLKAMPMLGIYGASWPFLQKPDVRGIPSNPLDENLFEYGWIDTRWRQPESRPSSAR